MKLVSRVEIAKPEVTYNLHVEDNHNYYANDVLVSNCHGAKASVLKDIITSSAKNIPHRFGLTGTLPKDKCDQMTIRTLLGKVRTEVNAKELMDLGHLATIDITMYKMIENLETPYQNYVDSPKLPGQVVDSYKDFKATYFPDYKSESTFVYKNKLRMQKIADIIQQKSMNGNVFVLVNDVTFGKAISKLIEGSIFLYGKNGVEERDSVYAQFQDRDDLIVFANAQIASTGLSIDRIHELFLVDMGKSFIKIIQSIGRGLRTATDKTHVNVTDIGSDLKYGNKHALDRAKHYREAEYPFVKKTIEY